MNNNEHKILNTNARFFDVNLTAAYKATAKEIAKYLVNSFGKNKRFSFVCGVGGNGLDGICSATELHSLGVYDCNVYLIGRNTDIYYDFGKKIWSKMAQSEINYKQDCYAKDIKASDVTIECIVGVGLKGERLNKRNYDVVKRVSHLDTALIAMDVACPHYEPDVTISINYPKTSDAIVMHSKFPSELYLKIGPGDAKYIFKPNRTTYKSKNGNVAFIFDDEDTQNIKLEEKLKEISSAYLAKVKTLKFSDVVKNDLDVEKELAKTDSILIKLNPEPFIHAAFLEKLIKIFPEKKIILDLKLYNAAGIKSSENLIVTKFAGKITDALPKKLPGIDVTGNKILVRSKSGEKRADTSSDFFESNFHVIFLALLTTISSKNDSFLSLRAATFLSKLILTLKQDNPKANLREIAESAFKECWDF